MLPIHNRNKILVLGCPGSGKTTFSQRLSFCLDIPLYKMDDLYWDSGWKRPVEKEFLKKLKNILEEDKWIIDGNYMRNLDARLNYADLVLFLDSSTLKCLYRSLKRGFKRFLGEKSSLPQKIKNDKKRKLKFDLRFFLLILRFNKRIKPKIFTKIENRNIKLIVIKNG